LQANTNEKKRTRKKKPPEFAFAGLIGQPSIVALREEPSNHSFAAPQNQDWSKDKIELAW